LAIAELERDKDLIDPPPNKIRKSLDFEENNNNNLLQPHPKKQKISNNNNNVELSNSNSSLNTSQSNQSSFELKKPKMNG